MFGSYNLVPENKLSNIELDIALIGLPVSISMFNVRPFTRTSV